MMLLFEKMFRVTAEVVVVNVMHVLGDAPDSSFPVGQVRHPFVPVAEQVRQEESQLLQVFYA